MDMRYLRLLASCESLVSTVGSRPEAEVPKPQSPNTAVILTDERSWVEMPPQIDLDEHGRGALVPDGRVGHR